MSVHDQIPYDKALLQRVLEMGQSMSELMSELRILRRRVREVEAKGRQDHSALHDRNRLFARRCSTKEAMVQQAREMVEMQE